MHSQLDCPPHGYTKDDDGTVWYWEAEPNTGGVVFTERGTPIDHPIRSGDVPGHVRDHAETYVEALIEQNELPHY